LALGAAVAAFLAVYFVLKTLGNMAVEVASLLGGLAAAYLVYSFLA